MTYRAEADALDAEILECIERREVPDFDDLALRIFAHQMRYNRPYAAYCTTLGVTLEHMPKNWEAIPGVPAAAYKETALCTFDPSGAELVFQTSGTTAAQSGKHYMENSTLYDAALLAGFRDAMLRDAPQRLRYLLLVPNPAERASSSLGYMMQRVANFYGDGQERWYLQGETLDVDLFIADAHAAAAEGVPVCVAGTAFAFVQLIEALNERGMRSLPLPPFSRVMETGGFKGRTRVVKREDLYAQLSGMFSIAAERVIAEYGMTELTSQYYDDGARVKQPPPWLRPRVVGPNGKTLPDGVVGSLVHVDLANRSSCVAVACEDLGVACNEHGVILIGREQGAELRGCSLDAEQLRTLQHT